MHIRLSTALGLPVVDDSEDLLGSVSGILVNPDSPSIEGFFVRMNGFFESETLFLASSGIEHWGSRIRVRNSDMLSPLEDMVRLSRMQEENRPVIGQQILTDAGRKIGRCADIQLDTRTLRLEWLFPRRWFRWGIPIPVSAILRVTPEAVIIRSEGDVPVPAEAAAAVTSAIETLTSTPAARSFDRLRMTDDSQ